MTQTAQKLLIDTDAGSCGTGDPRYEHQLELERIFDKHQLLPRVRRAFMDCQQLDFGKLMDEAGIDRKFGFELLAQIAIHKRTTVATMIGCLRHCCDSAQETATLLEQAVNAKLAAYLARDQQLVVIYEVSPKLQAELDRFQYPLPMVVPPKELHDNLDSGYLMGRSSVILRDNHTRDDVCLDHLNRLNATRFSLNLDVAQAIQNRWRGLDRKKDDETWEDFQKRRKAFEKYDRTAKGVIAFLLKEGNSIHFTHKYDKRGRSYCMGFHVNYQGTDWNKAIVELYDQEVLTE